MTLAASANPSERPQSVGRSNPNGGGRSPGLSWGVDDPRCRERLLQGAHSVLIQPPQSSLATSTKLVH